MHVAGPPPQQGRVDHRMKRVPNSRLTRLAPIVFLVILGLASMMVGQQWMERAPQGRYARIATMDGNNGQVVQNVPLDVDVDRTIAVRGPLGVTRIEVRGDSARVVSSPCPDKICVRMGWLSRAGEYAACIPNGVIVTIETSDE